MSGEFRIAYIINSMEGGGAALPVPSIVEVMRDAGAEVRVFALTRRDGRALAALRRSQIDVAVREGGENDHLAAIRWLNRELAAWRPTHVWTSLSRATLLGQIVGAVRRLPVVSWQHAAFLKPANRRLLRASQRLSKLWIGDSETITRLTGERLKVPQARLTTWPIFKADLSAPPARPWRFGETLRIGSLGRLHPIKGFDILVEALALLPQGLPAFEVEVAGEGSERSYLEAFAERRGVKNIKFLGYCEDAPNFLAGLNLYVQPSRSEGLCVAAHEAIQAGLPIIASAVGELPSSVTSKSGVIVPPGDPRALAGALEKLLREPEALRAMGRSGRKIVLDRFGPERFRAVGLALLERVRVMTA